MLTNMIPARKVSLQKIWTEIMPAMILSAETMLGNIITVLNVTANKISSNIISVDIIPSETCPNPQMVNSPNPQIRSSTVE